MVNSMKKMRLSDIKIKDTFAATTPREEKMHECRDYYLKHGTQDRVIVVNHSGELIDGYIMYLVLQELGEEEAEIKISDRCKKWWRRKENNRLLSSAYRNHPTTYIWGLHPHSDKEYMWRVSNKRTDSVYKEILPGDAVLVDTKYGKKSVIVTRIETLDKCPSDRDVKKYICKLG